MTTELRRLTLDDAEDIYEMLQEMPSDENGFINGMNGKSYEQFRQWLIKSDENARGEGLEDWMVPQSTFWLYTDGRPVGFGKVRHRLTERLEREGGHIGYAVRPSARGKGYGTLLLKLLVREAAKLGINRVLLTIHSDNLPSQRVALGNGGLVEKMNEGRHYIWINCEA